MADHTQRDFAHESCILACLIEGIGVLQEASDGNPDCPQVRRARNALMPFIETVIERAWALNVELERAENSATARGEVTQ